MQITREDSPEIPPQVRENMRNQVGFQILPREITREDETEFAVFESDSNTLVKVWTQEGIESALLDVDAETTTAVERSAEWILPAVYVSYEFVRNNPEIFKKGFVVLAQFVENRVNREVELSVVQEQENGEVTKFDFRGHPKDLEELPDRILESAFPEETESDQDE